MTTSAALVHTQDPPADLGPPSGAAGSPVPIRRALLAGARGMVPLMLAVTPQGLTIGLALGQTPTDHLAAWSASWLIYSGSAQLAAVATYSAGSAAAAAVLAAMAVNIRLLFYSAALAPHWRHRSMRWRLLAGYLLVDPSFMLAQQRHDQPGSAGEKAGYYLGGGLLLWLWWQLVTAIGILAPAVVPNAAWLAAAAPLCFVAILASKVRGRVALAAAAASAVAAFTLAALPWGAGLGIAIVAGVSAGSITRRRTEVSP
jgi:predicted branched-subunit amino acid permease